MIATGHYNHTNPDINDRNFPLQGEGEVPLDLILVHFNRDITSKDAIAELKQMGLRPATLPELLALGEKYPEEQRQYRSSLSEASGGTRAACRACRVSLAGSAGASSTLIGLPAGGLLTAGSPLFAHSSLNPGLLFLTLDPWTLRPSVCYGGSRVFHI